MSIRIIGGFKLSFLIGLILLFLSPFMEWYSYQIFTLEYELVVSWKFNIFLEWSTSLFPNTPFNEVLRPENLAIPLVINVLLFVSIILSGYVILFKNIERVESLHKFTPYSYILGFLLLLNLFYIIIFPVMYLLPHGLYFPFLQIVDYDSRFIYFLMCSQGYILQCIAFPLIFPYSIFYFKTISTFQQKERTPETIITKIIEKAQEPIDLDKLIAQEELKQKFYKKTPLEDNLEDFITTFIEGNV